MQFGKKYIDSFTWLESVVTLTSYKEALCDVTATSLGVDRPENPPLQDDLVWNITGYLCSEINGQCLSGLL